MLLSRLDDTLSYKIGDPVSENGDGITFTKKQRIKYLERAYARMIRVLPKLMKEYCPEFATTKTNYSFPFVADKNKYTESECTSFKMGNYIYPKINGTPISFKKVHQLRVSLSTPDKTFEKFAEYINSNTYLSALYKEDSLYQASPETPFYTILSGKIFLLPMFGQYSPQAEYKTGHTYNGVNIVYTDDALELLDSSLEQDIPITNDYVDLLIIMAAYEAMQDIARQDKAGLYANDITGQLNILTGYAQSEKATQGVTKSE